jgi:uncharacterized SAM-binding protein YcdF (DUF218 family)
MAPSLKSLLVPGSIAWLALMLLASGVLLASGGRLRRVGGVVLAITLAAYAVLSTPVVACALTDHLAEYGPLREPTSATAVVLLDGDNPSARLDETLRLYRWLHPSWVVISGDQLPWEELIRDGVPRDRILVDATSETTREQALHVAALLRAHRIDSSVLVASAIQMPRALGAFRAAGVDAVASASPLDWRGPCDGASVWIPSRDALEVSKEAIYEYLALAYYDWRGWLAPADDMSTSLQEEQSQLTNDLSRDRRSPANDLTQPK